MRLLLAEDEIQPPDEGKKYLSFGGIFVLYD